MLKSKRMQNIVQQICLLSFFLGSVVIIGWYIGSSRLVQLSPTFMPMQYNTALSFVLCAIGIFTVSLDLKQKKQKIIFFCGVTLFAVGSLTLLQYIFDLNLHIDELFMKHYIFVHTPHPGRMAPSTAFCFTLIGLVLIFRYFSIYSIYTALLGSILLGIGSITFLGYVSGLGTAYLGGSLLHMAMHTSFLFMCLGVAVIILDNSYHISLQQKLEEQLLAEHTLVKISTRFVGARLEDIDKRIEQSLEEVLYYIGAQGACFFIVSDNQTSISIEHMVCKNSLDIDKSWISDMPLSEHWVKKLKEQEALRWNPQEELGELNETFQKFILPSKIDSVLDVSVQKEDKIVAIISFLNPQKKESTSSEINFIKLVTSMFVNALQEKNIKLQIKNMNEELLVKIEKRTQKLKLANEDLHNIVHLISHDLRSPLVNIIGYSGELVLASQKLEAIITETSLPLDVKKELDDLLEEDIKDSLHYIDIAIKKMDKLLEGMLQLSKLDRLTLAKEHLDMKKLLHSVLDSIHFQRKKMGAVVEIRSAINIHGDEVLINQVFSNIIENSLKYRSESRPLHIQISSEMQESSVVYCIEDNGIGIATKNQEKIFELFFRESNSKETGDGLGLNIVQRILKYHDAKIWVKSELNVGSSFFLEFPVSSTYNEEISQDQ